jgi:hypothetical protein|tara:strand:+ start:824 stop:1024 length:201 start_codon:yes stop_codon:yes gene_type:complete
MRTDFERKANVSVSLNFFNPSNELALGESNPQPNHMARNKQKQNLTINLNNFDEADDNTQASQFLQ